MAIETREKEINGVKYACSQFPGRHGMKIQARVVALLGPLLGGAMALGAEEGEVEPDKLAGAFLNLSKVKPDEFMSLAFDLLTQTTREGRLIDGAVFDIEYAGNYGELYKALVFVLDVNFSSLFGASGISGLTARLAKMTGKKAPPAPAVN